MSHPVVEELLARSHRLGADRRNTNYAGGNTSAKGVDIDPATGTDVELLWVKGSGGDLGTLTEPGLAVLRLDRLRSLVDVYPGEDREDEMVAAFDHCLHGRGGAAPSIDTAMHGLVDADHVDHLHPDSGIAIATAVDGEALTKDIYGDKVVWVPWRRPGFQLGLDIRAVKAANPQAVGVILGGHGITAWGGTSAEAEANSLWIIEQAQAYIDTHGDPTRSGPSPTIAGHSPRPSGGRRLRHWRRTFAPPPRHDQRMVGHFTDADVVLDFLASEKLPALAALGTSCPDHFLRTKVKPLVLDLPATASVEECVARLGDLHDEYRADYRAYYERHATAGLAADAGRRPDHRPRPRCRDVLLRPGQADRPRRRRVLRQRHQRHAGRRGRLDLRPDPREREVPDRVLGARGGQAPPSARRRSVTPAASPSSPGRPAGSARPSPPSWRPTAPVS